MRVPFDLLHTFVVVTRAERMSRAAAMLGVTPGAISQRIKELEILVGRKLLARSPTGIELTRAGRHLLDRVREPFSDIEAAYVATTGRVRGQRVIVSATPSFAANWLVKRLANFEVANRGIEISVESDVRVADLLSDPIDVAIRHGLGTYPGLESHWLMAPQQIVVGSPGLLIRKRSFARPEDCLNYPLLHDIARKDWSLWLKAHGSDAPVPSGGLAFSDDNLLIRAAAAGQGLALVFDTYAADELAAGRLVQPYKGSWPTQFAYYIVGLPRTLRRPAVRRFCDWLKAEAAKV
jgi:LysR family transcriptional regulator, glycine cleavage system transcriptional activator